MPPSAHLPSLLPLPGVKEDEDEMWKKGECWARAVVLKLYHDPRDTTASLLTVLDTVLPFGLIVRFHANL